MIPAGSLRTPIAIQVQSTTTDAIGQPVTEWVDFALVRANVRHLSGTESIKADAVTSVVKASIRIRPLAGVHAGMRVIAEGNVYSIQSVIPDMQYRTHTDLVTELIQ